MQFLILGGKLVKIKDGILFPHHVTGGDLVVAMVRNGEFYYL